MKKKLLEERILILEAVIDIKQRFLDSFFNKFHTQKKRTKELEECLQEFCDLSEIYMKNMNLKDIFGTSPGTRGFHYKKFKKVLNHEVS